MSKLNGNSFLRAMLVRAARTWCQSAIAAIGTTAAAVHEVDWMMVLSTATLSAILSMLTSIATGLPEA